MNVHLTEIASAMVRMRVKRLDPRWFIATHFSATVFFQERNSHKPMRVAHVVARRMSPQEQIARMR
jgi:hypothetical protein